MADFQDDDEDDEQATGEFNSDIEHISEYDPDEDFDVDAASGDFSDSSASLKNGIYEPDLDSYDVPSDPPEMRLIRLRQQNIMAISLERAKLNRIKCLAISKILYQPCDWRIAQAHIDLAAIYERGKSFGAQALLHVNTARNILLSLKESSSQEKQNVDEFGSNSLTYLLMRLYLIMGQANIQLKKYKNAENSLRKALLAAETCGLLNDHSKSIKADILSTLSVVLCKCGRIGEAVGYIEDAIGAAETLELNSEVTLLKLWKQLGDAELLNEQHANVARVVESYTKALDIARQLFGDQSVQAGEVLVVLAKAKVHKAEEKVYNEAEEHLKQAIDIYVSVQSEPKSLVKVHQFLIKIFIEQRKYSEAEAMLEKCIADCEGSFGDTSILCAEFYELIGTVMFLQKKSASALKYLIKAEEIYKGKCKCSLKREKIQKLIMMMSGISKDEFSKRKHSKFK